MLKTMNGNYSLVLRLVPRLPRSRASLITLAACGVLVCSQALAQRVPVGALPSGPASMPIITGAIRGPEVLSGSFAPYSVNGSVATIKQNDPAGILRWATFDIGQGARVVFEQPSSSSVVLNKVDGGYFQNKTVIEGMLQANGQVYIYNPNGVIIGRTGQIDVNTLLATSLNIDNARFMRGLLSPYDGTAQLIIDPAFKNNPGAVLVEGSVVARNGGRIILAGPTVTNDGSLVTDGGQVILAAGRQIFLASSADANMRGLLVEVSNADTHGGVQGSNTSTVTNTAAGQIRVGEGNATMVGYAVNQQGLVSATTTVDKNGSIWLLARDGGSLNTSNPSQPVSASRGGVLTLAENSRTEIILTEKTETGSDGRTVNRTLADSDRTLDKVSQVLLSGETIRLKSGSAISAKAGRVDISAQSNPGNYDPQRGAPTRDSSNTAAQVVFESGASIDVSGVAGTALPMESLSMAVELRGSQLADSPMLRNGPLRGKTVYVDVRKGTAIANIAGDLALRESTLGELAGRGGSVNVFADGSASFAEGASINVSGGWIDYQSGRVMTSMLRLPNGSLVDIAKASKDVLYTAIVNPVVTGRRGIEAGYREGFSAGKVAFDAPSLLVAGQLSGQVQRGPLQRDPKAANFPAGASLLIGDTYKAFNQTTGNPNLPNAGDLGGDQTNYGYLGDVVLGRAGRNGDASGQLNVDPEALAASGFSLFRIATGGNVSTVKDISLPDAATLGVAAAGTVSLDHSVRASGGTVAVGANSVVVSPGSSIDVAGRWVNDLPPGKGAAGGRRDAAGRLEETLAIAGGNINLQGLGSVSVGAWTSLDVSGGAQLTSAGKVVGGSAGTITIGAAGAFAGQNSGLELQSGAKFSGYGLTTGGTLKLQGRDAFLGGKSPFAGAVQVAGADPLYDLWLADAFFQQGGFAKYEITAGGNATIQAGTSIAPRQANWFLPRDYGAQSSGSMAFANTVFLPLSGPQGSRVATNLTVIAKDETAANAGRLVMAATSSIVTDPGGQVTLRAGRQLTVDGSIAAPAGKIALELSKTSVSGTDVYMPERSIWVGDNARLTALGSSERMTINTNGVASGEVLDGGTITIGGAGGQIAAGHVVVSDGAQLDVSGIEATYALKNNPRTPVAVASAGGAIDVRARESLIFNGTAKGAAGGASAVGGSFTAILDRESSETPPAGFPSGTLDLALLASANPLPGGLLANGSLTALAGKGQVAAPMLQAGRFDSIRLKSQHTVTLDFNGGNQLSLMPRLSLMLDAPVIAARNGTAGALATLAADYVNVGNSNPLYQAAQVSTWGDAKLALSGTTVDLTGDVALQGFKETKITATEALRLVGVGAELASNADGTKPTDVDLKGALRAQGRLDVVAGQVYPTTLSQFELVVSAPARQESTISIDSNGAVAPMPFSAGGSLHLLADHILQSGVVRAPLGELVFSANKTLIFDEGSLTSVAASGLIPFGKVLNGREWIYDFGSKHYMTVSTDGSSDVGVLALPEKRIVTEAPSVSFKAGSTVDLSGGGDLYAAEFLPGPGGSKNVLANDGKTFAILPAYQSAYAPIDPQNTSGSGLKVGDRVYLAGGNGLAAGYYTLLPAEYALLPGGYAISAISGSRDADFSKSVVNRDASLTMAGKRVVGGSGLGDSRWSGFLLTSGAQIRKQTEYGEYQANTFFADQASSQGKERPTLANDGGTLVVDVGSSLLLKGDFLLGGADGRKGKVDLAAQDLIIVSDENTPGGAGMVKVSVADLRRLDAGSLLLGARRDASGLVTVKANSVTLANDSEHELVAPDITLAATDTVTVRENAVIRGSGATNAETLTLSGSGANADGALLRVTGRGLGEVIRTAPDRAKGTLDIKSGAVISGEGGVNVDATRETKLAQAPVIGAGGGFAFGTDKISMGDSVPVGTTGVVFNKDALKGFDSLSRLTLTSYGGFDFHGNVDLGTAAMDRLALNGAGIRGFGSTAVLTAKTIAFANSGRDATSGSAPALTAGSLTIKARDIVFGSALTRAASKQERSENHDFDVSGFALTSLEATSEVRGEGFGNGALRALDGNMKVSAPRMTATGGARAKLEATTGALTTLQAGTTTAALPIGGSLVLAGSSISHGGTAIAASGSVRLEADGALVLENGSVTSAAGQAIKLGDETVNTDGGTVELVSKTGAVTAGEGSIIDVSGPERGGKLLVSAVETATEQVGGQTLSKGRFVVESDAILKGGGSTKQASAVVDAGSLTALGALNNLLNSVGFGESRQFRARSGDVGIASGESIKAHEIMIAADQGNVSIGGTLDARGESGGTIKVYAAQATGGDGKGNVLLESTARLLASATTAATSAAGKTGDGGYVEVGTSTADGSMPADKFSGSVLTVQNGARIDVSAAGAGDGGRVVLRAPRTGTDEGQDVAILGNLSALVVGARDAMIEAVKVYDESVINAATTSTNSALYTETAKFVADNKATILSDLGSPAMRLQGGLEIRSAGDMLVSVNETKPATAAADRGWNLNAWRFGGEPVSLTLRATDSLEVSGSISDGFVKPTNAKISMPDWLIDGSGSSSASYRFVAAADFTAANPLAVNARSDTSGDFRQTFTRSIGTTTDQPVALIRTGTGNIDVAAGHDVVFGSFVTNQGEVLASQIYTAGRPTLVTAGYTAPGTALNTSYLGSSASTLATAVFPSGGGDVSIFADHDVQGVATSQLFSDWLFRQGQTKLDNSGNTVFAGSGSNVYATSWWVQFDRFNQNLATFGGGDVRVEARTGDVANLSASSATTAYVAGAPGTAVSEKGGGNVDVRAGGDIRGGAYYAQKGGVSLGATGDITVGDRILDYTNPVDGEVIPLSTLPIIGLGDAQARVVAGGNAGVETVLNPTLIPQTSDNASSASKNSRFSYFGTYSDRSSAEVVSLAGGVRLGNSINALKLVNRVDPDTPRSPSDLDSGLSLFYTYYPGSVAATAVGGSIDVGAGFSMAPTAKGQLALLAKGSVKANTPQLGDDLFSIVMLDRDPLMMPSTSRPAGNETMPAEDLLNALSGEVKGLAYHTSGGLHAGDSVPVKIVAAESDIVGRADTTYSLIAPKAGEISAGGDIKDFGVYLQHLKASDTSTIKAGGSITAPTEVDGSSSVAFRIGGPGRLEMLAGKDIDFGNSQGLLSVGNSDNAYLPAVADYGTNVVYKDPRYGADLLLAAGLAQGLKYEEFLYSRLPSTLSATLTDAARLTVIAAQGDGHFHRLDGSVITDPTADEVWASFKAQAVPTREAFYKAQVSNINDAFFAAVITQAQNGKSDLAAFDALIASYVQPGGTKGDINVFGSQIKTLRRGNIDIFTLNGSLYAGVVSTPASLLAAKTAADLGIFTVSGGEIRVLVGQDISVNQGRIFSLSGGDITLVSQYQDIDAGRGAKTAASAPPPTLEFDAFGNARVDISSSVAGSGIRTLKTGADVPRASVYAASPRGVFDAGDAGVGSSGDVVLVAASVLNANNISAGGAVSGTPAVDASGLGGAVSAPTVQTSRAEDVARNVFGGKDALAKAFTFLTVDVLGFGDGNETAATPEEKKRRERK